MDTGARTEAPALVANMPLSAQQRRVAFGIIIFLSVVFAMVVPVASKQVARVDVFIPVIQSLICFADLITAVFLFAQYSIQPQRALLALASGYIFSGLFAFLQTLDFPGAYSAKGLFGGTPSGAAWLFSFWHITFPLCVVAYVLLKDRSETSQYEKQEPLRVIAITVVGVLAVTAGLTWLGTAGATYLPALFTDTMRQTPFVQNFSGAMWLLNAVALVVLLARMRTILDVWLVVTLFVSLPDLSLSFFYVVVRYSIGWYTARSYALIASCTVLFVLLVETTMLYARLANAMILQRRERTNRLMSVDEATAAVAHEISQPLGAMSLNCETALAYLKTSPLNLEEIRSCLLDVMADNSRAREIVSGIRSLFKAAPGQRTAVEVSRLVQDVLRMVENDLQVHGISVSTEFQEDVPKIMVDPTQLQQVILNLIRNAIDAIAIAPGTTRAVRLVATKGIASTA
jgi:signal transduction histidine kinase